MKLNKYIKKFCIYKNKKIIDVLNQLEKTGVNLLLVIGKKNNFLGIITISDVRRAFVNGYNKNSFIQKFVNYKPLFLKDHIDENQISNIISSPKFNEINPPLIPVVDKKNIPYKILNKNNVSSSFVKKKKINYKPNILLIGGAGYIGTILAKKLLLQNFNVTIFDKFIYLSEREIKNKLKNKNIKLIKGDSRHIDKVFSVVKQNDIVIHLAELVGDSLCEQRPSKTYEVNYLASMAIGNICKNLGVSKFIYISSCSVYGARKDEKIFNESSGISPLSVYAKLKALSEKTIIRNLGEYCRPCILRLGTVFGESLRPRYDLVINLFAGLIANNKKIIIKGGNQWRPFIHVNDVCDAIIKIIKLNKNITNGQVFNLASYNYKISQIREIIKKIYPNTKVEYKKLNEDKRNYKVSSSKAKKILNFKPKVSVERGIKDLVKFTRNKKIKNIKQKKFLNILNAYKF